MCSNLATSTRGQKSTRHLQRQTTDKVVTVTAVMSFSCALLPGTGWLITALVQSPGSWATLGGCSLLGVGVLFLGADSTWGTHALLTSDYLTAH
jgi:hypothetical protein